MNALLYYLIVINVVTFLVYGIDKWKAKQGRLAHIGSNLADTGYHWWLHRSITWNEGLAA